MRTREMLLEDPSDHGDLVRIYDAIAFAAEYIDSITCGREGHHVVEVRVNDRWAVMTEAKRQEEIRVIAILLRPHMRRWHEGVEAQIRVKYRTP